MGANNLVAGFVRAVARSVVERRPLYLAPSAWLQRPDPPAQLPGHLDTMEGRRNSV